MSHDCNGHWPTGNYVGNVSGAAAPTTNSTLMPLVRQLGDSSDQPLGIDAAMAPETFTTADGVVLTDADGNPYGSN